MVCTQEHIVVGAGVGRAFYAILCPMVRTGKVHILQSWFQTGAYDFEDFEFRTGGCAAPGKREDRIPAASAT